MRAVAVVPVILFHAGLDGFEGGFLGVDIFFVISGYLITSILIAQIAEGRFSLVDFYERRARRILPALAVVVLGCIPFAEWLLLPQQRIDFWQSVAAVGLFSSNVLFWIEADYFAPAAELKPLLHTWSLAVEEQFYIVFPLLLLAVWRSGWGRTLAVVLALAALSMVCMEYLLRTDPSANFYLPFSRGWELMAGAVCALLQWRFGQWRSGLLAGLGLLLVAGSLAMFSESIAFPSLWGVLPVAGVCLLILFASERTAVAWLLRLKPFVGIGLISYSAYLWHQPLFAFYRLWSLAEPAIWQMLGLSLLSVGLAAFSYHVVEQPFRRRGPAAPVSRRAIFRVSGSLVTGAVAAAFLLSGPRERDGEMNALLASTSGTYGLGGRCGDGVLGDPECRTAADPEILVWGDSIAGHTVQMILGVEPEAKLQQATYFSCRPALNASPAVLGVNSGRDPRKCLAFNQEVEALLREDNSIRYVVIAAAYDGLAEAGSRALTPQGTVKAGHDWYVQRLRELADFIRSTGREPIFVEAPPRSGSDVGGCVVKAGLRDVSPERCDVLLTHVSDGWRVEQRLMDEVAGFASVIRPAEAMCDADGRCAALANDGSSLYRDAVHFSDKGAALIGRRLQIMNHMRGAETRTAGTLPEERPAETASLETRG